jgi:hypothetical protein
MVIPPASHGPHPFAYKDSQPWEILPFARDNSLIKIFEQPRHYTIGW